MRYTTLDGFRGFFLVFMAIVHANALLGATLGKLNHHYFGWVEDAQGFVFISGLVVGLVYGKKYLRKGATDCRNAIFRRISTIYTHQVALLVILVAMGTGAFLGGIDAGFFAWFTDGTLDDMVAAMLLVDGPTHMGILPMYIWFMLLTPVVIHQLMQGRAVLIGALSLAIWGLAQTGVAELAAARAELFLTGLTGTPIHIGIYFNLMGWQLLFVTGLIGGTGLARGTLDLGVLAQSQFRGLFFLALGAIVALGLLDRMVFDDWFGPAFSREILDTTDRGLLSPLYVVAFVVDLFVIVWLMTQGRHDPLPPVRWASDLLHRVFGSRPLVYLGQHSLTVFAAHIVLVYALDIYLAANTVSSLTANLIVLASPLPLFAAAWAHEAWGRRGLAAAQAARAV